MTAPLSADDALTTEAVIKLADLVEADLVMVKSLLRQPATDPEAWLDSALAGAARLRAALARLRAQGAPQTEAVLLAMDALESDATIEMRMGAWNQLRDVFFPPPRPDPQEKDQ